MTDASQDPCPPPNGGYGWVCTVVAATINMHSWGFNSAYAVFLAHYLTSDTFPGSTPLQYAFVGSLSLTFLFLVSPIATYSTQRYGIRPTMMVGVVLETISFIAASFATQMWHLFLTQGLLFGMSLGLLFIPTASVVPQWFTTKRSLASGVSLAGAGLGGGVYSLSAAAMIRTVGLQWAFRILAVIAFTINGLGIMLIKDRHKHVKPNRSTMAFSLFTRIDYSLLVGFGAFTMFSYFILIFSLANFANSIGLNSSQAAVISALFNFSQAIGRPLFGYFSDSFGRINMAAAGTFATGVLCLAVWIPTNTYAVTIFFAVSSGLVGGNFWALIAPLMSEVLDLKEAPSGLSLLWFSLVIPSTFSEPLALEIVGGTGNYLGTQIFTAIMYVTAAACLGILRGIVIQRQRKELNHQRPLPVGCTAGESSSGEKSDQKGVALWRCCFSLGKV
ncbi:major facilitator superfamily transporter (Mch2) [Fusarium pseudocircinatum]|uniref:Major facilitator superfamily transporter (Mch2) n=1 Tax=Fusarium pseudocircinatum TaxID=56676 RepID=A0A8H5L245_9HYPO|nr:major facilitator superfamily transporter (Mch2) [Fusarium pseudocircinatum]